jgi:hypothetical protein
VATKELAVMDAQLVETTIKTYLTEIRRRLDNSAGIGRAADACAGAGFHEKGLEVALDMEQLLYEATTLLNAASLINRTGQQIEVIFLASSPPALAPPAGLRSWRR